MSENPGENPLYDYLFHYNPHTELWSAFKREDKESYFNGEKPRTEILKAKDIRTLIGFIAKSSN